jgi:hypothetical protein
MILHLIFCIVFVVLFFLLVALCLYSAISGILYGTRRNDYRSLILGILALFIFLFFVLYPFVYGKKFPACNEPYSDEYQYCPKDGTKLEE